MPRRIEEPIRRAAGQRGGELLGESGRHLFVLQQRQQSVLLSQVNSVSRFSQTRPRYRIGSQLFSEENVNSSQMSTIRPLFNLVGYDIRNVAWQRDLPVFKKDRKEIVVNLDEAITIKDNNLRDIDYQALSRLWTLARNLFLADPAIKIPPGIHPHSIINSLAIGDIEAAKISLEKLARNASFFDINPHILERECFDILNIINKGHQSLILEVALIFSRIREGRVEMVREIGNHNQNFLKERTPPTGVVGAWGQIDKLGDFNRV